MHNLIYNKKYEKLNEKIPVTRESFAQFGKSFQEDLCQLILSDRVFADQMIEVLDLKFLELQYLRIFVKKIWIYKEKYKAHPDHKRMMVIVRTELESETDSVKVQIRDFLAKVISHRLDDGSKAYIKDKALDFCRKQKLKEALMTSVELINDSSFDEVASVINQALSLGCDMDFGHDYVKDFEERFKPAFRNPVSTGWPVVDNLTKGGLGAGELGMVIAPTGAGKSMVLCHLGSAALKEGKNVVHYTLELSDKVVAGRYDSCITKIHLNDLHSRKEEIMDLVLDIPGSLTVKEYPTKSASVVTIRNHLEKVTARGTKPDLIIVDYADLLKAVGDPRIEKRHQLESLYEDLRALAQEFDCPVWTASQTNRTALNAEVITIESISEALSKCFVADFIVSVSRTMQDRDANTGRLIVNKNRNGPDGMIYDMFMDTSNIQIKVLPHGKSVEDTKVERLKKEKEVLKEKFKKYKNSK